MSSNNEIQALKHVLLRALGFDLRRPPPLEDDTPLFGDEGLCLDSIDAMAISTAVLKAYGVNLEDHAAFRSVFLANCKALWGFIQTKQEESAHAFPCQPIGPQRE